MERGTRVLTPDLLVAGAGPAGVSAALWARTRGLSVVIVERAPRPGGQLHAIHFHPRELPGIESGDGAAIAAAYARQLEVAEIGVRYGCGVAAIEAAGNSIAVTSDARERIETRALLIATGLRRRRLDVPGERELTDRGVSHSATRDRASFAGKPAVVVGGGDAAYENALLLAEVGCDVTLVVRDRPVARADFQARVAAHACVRVLGETHVVAFLGAESLEAVRAEGAGGRHDIAAAGAVVKIGAIPATDWCADMLARDADGYLIVDGEGRTSRACVWAAGDVTRPALPAIVVAQGGAALAVASITRALRGTIAG